MGKLSVLLRRDCREEDRQRAKSLWWLQVEHFGVCQQWIKYLGMYSGQGGCDGARISQINKARHSETAVLPNRLNTAEYHRTVQQSHTLHTCCFIHIRYNLWAAHSTISADFSRQPCICRDYITIPHPSPRLWQRGSPRTYVEALVFHFCLFKRKTLGGRFTGWKSRPTPLQAYLFCLSKWASDMRGHHWLATSPGHVKHTVPV